MTEKQKIRLYKKYHIPWATLTSVSSIRTKKDKDRDIAYSLISENQPIPKDLEERLLEYVKQDKKGKKRGIDEQEMFVQSLLEYFEEEKQSNLI